jgi:hypothetical protein
LVGGEDVVVVTSREHTNMIRQDNGLSRCRPASSSALALIDRQKLGGQDSFLPLCIWNTASLAV